MDEDFISEHIKVFCRLRPDLPEDSGGDNDFYLTGRTVHLLDFSNVVKMV